MNCKCPRISSPPLKALSFGGPLLIADPARYLMEGEASDGSRFATDCCNVETSLFWAFRTGCSVVLVTLPGTGGLPVARDGDRRDAECAG